MCWHPSWLPLILSKTFRGHAWTPRRSAWSSASLMGCWTARLCMYVCNKTLPLLRTMTPRRSWATSLSLRRRSSHATELGDSHRSSKQGSLSCLTRPTPWNWLARRWWAKSRKSTARLVVFGTLAMAHENQEKAAELQLCETRNSHTRPCP